MPWTSASELAGSVTSVMYCWVCHWQSPHSNVSGSQPCPFCRGATSPVGAAHPRPTTMPSRCCNLDLDLVTTCVQSQDNLAHWVRDISILASCSVRMDKEHTKARGCVMAPLMCSDAGAAFGGIPRHLTRRCFALSRDRRCGDVYPAARLLI